MHNEKIVDEDVYFADKFDPDEPTVVNLCNNIMYEHKDKGLDTLPLFFKQIIEMEQDRILNGIDEDIVLEKRPYWYQMMVQKLKQEGKLSKENLKKGHKIREKFKISDDQLFLVYDRSKLVQYCTYNKKVVHNFGCYSSNEIYSIATSHDKKSLYVSSNKGGFDQFDIQTHKKINYFKTEEDIMCMAITYDGRFLFAASVDLSLKKWCLVTKKLVLTTTNHCIDIGISTLKCTYDNRFVIIGQLEGFQSVFDQQKDSIVRNFKAFPRCPHMLPFEMQGAILNIAVTKNSQHAYVSDWSGDLKKLSLNSNISLTDKYPFHGNSPVRSLCLILNDEILLIGCNKGIFSLDLTYRKLKKFYITEGVVINISLFEEKAKALIVGSSGHVSQLDLATISIIDESPLDLYEEPIGDVVNMVALT